jgi:hypothetical protein
MIYFDIVLDNMKAILIGLGIVLIATGYLAGRIQKEEPKVLYTKEEKVVKISPTEAKTSPNEVKTEVITPSEKMYTKEELRKTCIDFAQYALDNMNSGKKLNCTITSVGNIANLNCF